MVVMKCMLDDMGGGRGHLRIELHLRVEGMDEQNANTEGLRMSMSTDV
jgi:hypothetical protein